jgi:Kef-type K+ transport system membrane component KefB
LCRILTEFNLFDTSVGVAVIAAGVFNDLIGWILLALSVAIVNAGSGLTALWIFFLCIGWTLFMLFIVRKVLFWVAVNTGSIENGPTMFFTTFTILILFVGIFHRHDRGPRHIWYVLHYHWYISVPIFDLDVM